MRWVRREIAVIFMSELFYLCFPLSFIIVGLTLRSLIHFTLFLCMMLENVLISFPLHSSFPSTSQWRDYLFSIIYFCLLQFSSVAQLCPTLCNSMDCSTPGLPVHHQLPEFTQTHVHWVGDAIQPSHPLSSPSAPSFNLAQHQGFFQESILRPQVAKVLEFQFQHQSFQWLFRTDFL